MCEEMECMNLLKNEACMEENQQFEEMQHRDNIFSEDFCAAMDSTTVPIYIIEPETYELLYCNDIVRQKLGRNPIGETCHKAIRNQDTSCASCVARRLYQEGINETTEYCTGDGEWILVQVSPLTWRGRELYKLVCLDITKQKRLEADLHLRNEEYSAVVSQSLSGIMRYDIATGTAAVNVDRNLNKVEEYTVQDYGKFICDSGIVEPDSIAEVKAMFHDICSGVPSRGYDIGLIGEKERLRWTHLDYVLIKNDGGIPYRAVVSFYDNTKQWEKELDYQRWNSRIKTLMSEYTAYMEVNLSENLIEAEGRYGTWEQQSGGRYFSEALELMAGKLIFGKDRVNFRNFFNRERLLGQFLAGNREGIIEYRTLTEGKIQWYKADLQMVSDPSNGNVKASILVSNVDLDMRERELLARKAERDAMTDLYNHATTESMIMQVLEQDTGERCCFLMIDLDDLRDINNSLGHPEGDRALKAIADCMRAQFRKSDIMGRIGGDEFVVLLRDVPEIERLQSSISGFMKRLNKIKIGPLNNKPVHASVGGTMGTAGIDDFDTLYRQADLALFYTKATGKNAFNLYVPELEKREFSYQPRSDATLMDIDCYDSAEIRKLLQAMSLYCPMVISANLTRNTYYMMEYKDYTSHCTKDEGSFDQLIQNGYHSFHPEDRESFLSCFKRENLLKAYAEGKAKIHHVGRQIGDDGKYHMVQTVAIFVKGEGTDDIGEISFTYLLPEEDA